MAKRRKPDEKLYDAVLKVLEELISLDPGRGSLEGWMLRILAKATEQYEKAKFPELGKK